MVQYAFSGHSAAEGRQIAAAARNPKMPPAAAFFSRKLPKFRRRRFFYAENRQNSAAGFFPPKIAKMLPPPAFFRRKIPICRQYLDLKTPGGFGPPISSILGQNAANEPRPKRTLNADHSGTLRTRFKLGP